MNWRERGVGTAFPYAILFLVLLCLSAGRYYGLDQWPPDPAALMNHPGLAARETRLGVTL